MPFRFHLLVPATMLAMGLSTLASAASLETKLSGSSLEIDTPCAKQVTIEPDPGLQGSITVSATADNQQELAQLDFEGTGTTARIHTRAGQCWKPEPFGSFTPTLQMVLHVPAGIALDVDESGTSRYTIGAVGGPLKVDISGDAELSSALATTLALSLSGNGGVDVGSSDGNAQIDISGHGNITLGKATLPSLKVSLSGAGNMDVKAGTIGHATLDLSGMGSVRSDAAVQDADVDISGAGSVHLASVKGQLHKDVSGMGSVDVGE